MLLTAIDLQTVSCPLYSKLHEVWITRIQWIAFPVFNKQASFVYNNLSCEEIPLNPCSSDFLEGFLMKAFILYQVSKKEKRKRKASDESEDDEEEGEGDDDSQEKSSKT